MQQQIIQAARELYPRGSAEVTVHQGAAAAVLVKLKRYEEAEAQLLEIYAARQRPATSARRSWF